MTTSGGGGGQTNGATWGCGKVLGIPRMMVHIPRRSYVCILAVGWKLIV